MTPHMKISEYIRRPDLPVPVEVMDKIYIYHAIPMSQVREILGKPIFVSQRSGYRPVEHEIERGRSGDSQHVFEAKGAADYICDDMDNLVSLMIENTAYTRICYYPYVNTPFIHADLKANQMQFFINDSGWKHVKKTEFFDSI